MREMRASAEIVKQHTDGRVEVRFYPGGVMGDAQTVLRKIKVGQLQGGAFTGGEFSEVDTDSQVYSFPFMLRNQTEVDQVRAKLDPLLKQSVRDHGFELLGIAGGGFAYLMSTHDIQTRDQIKAAKVWVPQGDKIAELAFKLADLGAVSLPLADVYTSLQTGLIDTAPGTTSGAIAFQWHTKVKYLLDLPLTYVMGLLAVDKKVFDTLSVEDRKALSDEFAAGFDRLDKLNRADNTAALVTLKQQGLQVVAPNATDRAEWERVGSDAYKQMTSAGTLTPEIKTALEAAVADVRGDRKP